MGGVVTIWALHLPEGVARDAQGFVGIGGPCASQKATVPEFPVTSVLRLAVLPLQALLPPTRLFSAHRPKVGTTNSNDISRLLIHNIA
jgi:hypothetical protein